jgi:cytochrome c oxidase subunit III
MPEMAASAVRPEPQYATISQQTEAATLGIWVFLATEIVFFSALLLSYTVLRHAYPAGFAEAGRETKLVIGSVNTAVLLTSSATMAWAVHIAKIGARRLLTILLIATAALGLVFVGLKGLEYSEEYRAHLVPGLNFSSDSPHAHAVELFYFLYFAMTGIHAVHLTIGIVIVGIIAWRASRGVFGPRYYGPVEVTGLYWHFVDLVWIFLYPLIYLNGRSG